MKKKVNEGLEMDMVTYKKVKGTLDPKTPIKITDDKPSPTTSTISEDGSEPEAVIEPKDKATIKYLSNVKDNNTGEISKPFTIGDKRYQMVRGTTPEKEVVMAVFCHDDMDEAGENIIHPVEYFEENVVRAFVEGKSDDNIKPDDTKKIEVAKPAQAPKKPNSDFDYAAAERDYHDKQSLDTESVKKPESNSLKLSEFKHFLVDKNTGKVRKFKRAEELAKCKMSDNETYMNLGQFKKHVDEALFGLKSRGKVSEVDDVTKDDQVKPDVNKAIEQMVLKVKPYIDKLNDDREKIQFIVKLTTMLQLDSSKYPLIMAGLKKVAGSTFGGDSGVKSTPAPVTENKVITKNSLINSITPKKVIKTIKIKDIK